MMTRQTGVNEQRRAASWQVFALAMLLGLSLAGAASAQFTITASAGANGAIAPTGATAVVAAANQTFTFTPNAGFQVADVIVDNVSLLYVQYNAAQNTPIGILNGAARITTYTFTNVQADHSIRVTFERLYSISFGNAGPAQPTFPFNNPGRNRYAVAGTTNPATGLQQFQYKYGDKVPVAFASVNPDYKFGQDATGDHEMEQQVDADLAATPTATSIDFLTGLPVFPADNFSSLASNYSGQGDIYWLVTEDTDPLAVDPITGLPLPGAHTLTGNGIPQGLELTTIHGNTTVTAWWTRADKIISGTLQDDSGFLTTGFDPSDPPGNIFEPLDTAITRGIRYAFSYFIFGPAAQLLFEDAIPVQTNNGNLGIVAGGAGNQMRIDIARDTGKPGAILFMPAGLDYTPGFKAIDSILNWHGVVQFGKLQIDRLGVNYQLEYVYVMRRARADGTPVFPVWPDSDAVPITDSAPFNISPAATGHLAWGNNTFGQLGIGLITPPSSDPNQTGLPLPANWQRTNPPAAVTPPAGEFPPPNISQLCPPNPAVQIDPLPGQSNPGPVGMPGDYTNGYDAFLTPGYPHFIDNFDSLLFNLFHFAGWFGTPTAFGDDEGWWTRRYEYPNDSYANGRDMLEPVQPYHQSASQSFRLDEFAFHSVSAGHGHSLALRDNGTLYAFGDNTYGQLGLGAGAVPTYTTPNGNPTFTDPRPLSGSLLGPTDAVSGVIAADGTGTFTANTLSDVTAVAAGFDHTVALKGDGTVWTFGRNNDGQLGWVVNVQGVPISDDVAGGHPTPTKVPGLPQVAAIAAGDYSSFALGIDGSVWAWGLNADGELGNGTRTNQAAPIQVRTATGGTFGATRFTGHTDAVQGAAASPDGQFVLTGSNDGTARLSNATTGAFIRTIASTGPNAHTGPINAVAFSPDSAMILTGSSDRTAKLWLPDGTFLHTFVDTTIGTSFTHKGSVTSVAFAPNFTSTGGGFLATASVDGTAKIWHLSIQGGVTTFNFVAAAVEPPVQPGLAQGMGITSVAFSPHFPAYSRFYTGSTDQTVKIWDVTSGQLVRNFTDVSVAHKAAVTSLAVLASGTNDLVVSGSTDCDAKLWSVDITADLETLVETFSSLFEGNTGGGTNPAGHSDAVLSVAIAADPVLGTFVLTGSKDKTVKRWLADPTGATASGLVDKSYQRHADWVNAVAFGFKAARARDVNLLLTASNDLTAILAKTPVVIALSGGSAHTLAIKEDGTVWGWGFNNVGQLGLGDTDLATRLNPIQVQDPSEPSGFMQLLQVGNDTTKIGVSAGNAHSLAMRDDGKVVCWGSNTYGELAFGPGTVGAPAFSGVPHQALDATGTAITGVQAVSAGWGYCLARGVGNVFAWGHNDHGQLGIDGPGVDPTTLTADQPSATPLFTTQSSTPGNCPPGDTFGHSPMSTISARYHHSQIISFADVDQQTGANIIMQGRTMTWNVDPPTVANAAGGGGIVVADTTMSGATAGTTSQTGVAGETIYTYTSATTGTVTAEPGTTVRLIAIPRPGFSFDHWSGFAPSQTPQTAWTFDNIVTAAKPLTMTAHFIAIPRSFTLTINIEVNGVLNPAAGTVTGAGTYNENDVATLTAFNSNPNFQFDHWSGDPEIASSTLNPAFLRMTANKTIVANYVAAVATPYTLTVHDNPPAGGTIFDTTVSPPKPLGNGSVSSYQQGTLLTLTAVPNAGFIFAGWVDNNGEVSPQGLSSTATENTSLPMTGPVTAKNITATYIAAPGVNFTLTTQALVNGVPSAAGGSITPISGSTFPVNTQVTVQAIPAAGFAFAGFSANVVPNAQNPTQGTVRLNQNQIVQANFTQGNLTLTVQSTPVTGVGITSPSGHGGTTNYSLAVAGNALVSLNAPATTVSGGSTFFFVRWTLNGFAEATGVTNLVFTMAGNRTAVAVYQLGTTAPAMTGTFPAAGSVQNPLDTLIQFHLTSPQSGVDFTKVIITVEGNVIYNGAGETPANSGVFDTRAAAQPVRGICYRMGTANDFTFLFVPTTVYLNDQLVHVTVQSADLAVPPNFMVPVAFTFTTQMRMFGKNLMVNNPAGSSSHRPATLTDTQGNIWMAWDDGGQIKIGESVWNGGGPGWIGPPAGVQTLAPAYSFGLSQTVSPSSGAAVALARDANGLFYVVWQDNRSGHLDIRAATGNGATFTQLAAPIAPTGQNQTNPSVAVDSTGKVYVAWEDMSRGVSTIFVTFSTNNGLTWNNPPVPVSPATAAQTHPSLAIDAANNVYLVWSDARNVPAGHGTDILGATSTDGNIWNLTTVVGSSFNHTAPVMAVEKTSSILHLAWVGDETGSQSIYYSSTVGGLPTSPISGINVVDDPAGIKTAPAIAVTGSSAAGNAVAYIGWEDSRNVTAAHPQDTDIYFCELRSGIPTTNVLVNDDTNLAAQHNPCIGVDINGNSFLGWADLRNSASQVWFAATAAPSTAAGLFAAQVIPAAGGTVTLALPAVPALPANGLPPVTPITTLGGAAVTIPAGALPAALPAPGIPVTVAQVVATPDQPDSALMGVFAFGVSGLQFTTPVTITFTCPSNTRAFGRYQPRWFNPLTGAWETSGIGNVQAVTVPGTPATATTPAIPATTTSVTFTSTHFTMFAIAGSGGPAPVPGTGGGGGGGGGCFIATSAYESAFPGLGGTLEMNSTGRYLLAPERLAKLDDIRGLRDELLLSVPEGRAFSAWYYALGPYAATAIRNNEPAKSAVRALVLNPLSELSRIRNGAESQ